MNPIYLLFIAETVHLGLTISVVEKSLILADNLHVNIKNGKINYYLPNPDNGAVLRGELGAMLPDHLKAPQVCVKDNSFEFGDDIKLEIDKDDHCHHFRWTTNVNHTLADCLHYDQDNWYGGPENCRQYWPFNNMTFNDFSYIKKHDGNQAIAEPYWVTSSGFYVYVNYTTPLFIDANNFYNNSFCLVAKQELPYLPRSETTLSYKICAYKNIREAHMKAVKTDLGRPTQVPDRRMIQHPIWSTWVRYKLDVNQTVIENFANKIVSHGFNNSQLEIDDNWESCYGSSKFNLSRFPNMPELALNLKKLGFRVTLWNHPFVDTECNVFHTLKNKGYLVESHNGTYNTTWWDGNGGAIDFLNPAAADWFVKEKQALIANNNIDGIKMDAGESSWLTQIPQMNASVYEQPDAYPAAFLKTIARFGDMVEVRTAHRSQHLPVFVRMMDKDTAWGFENGLATVITTMFQMNLNGYTLVLPDMIGGNCYNGDIVTKELMIRWLQANTFMPVVQFSVSPFDFDNETVEICKKFTAMHYEYSDRIIEQIEKCIQTGEPVNPPIWFVDPTDETAHSIWSEFMMGDDILVAPVVEKGARSRDIYLPKGHWRAEADPNKKVYEGRQWLRNYPAPLDTLPFFTRQHQS